MKTMSDTEEWRSAVRRFSENEGDFPYPDEDDLEYNALAAERDKRVEAAFVADLCPNWYVYGGPRVLGRNPHDGLSRHRSRRGREGPGDCDHDVLYGEESIWYLTQRGTGRSGFARPRRPPPCFGERTRTRGSNPAPVYSGGWPCGRGRPHVHVGAVRGSRWRPFRVELHGGKRAIGGVPSGTPFVGRGETKVWRGRRSRRQNRRTWGSLREVVAPGGAGGARGGDGGYRRSPPGRRVRGRVGHPRKEPGTPKVGQAVHPGDSPLGSVGALQGCPSGLSATRGSGRSATPRSCGGTGRTPPWWRWSAVPLWRGSRGFRKTRAFMGGGFSSLFSL